MDEKLRERANSVAWQMHKDANDLDSLAASYEGQRQGEWFKRFADHAREAYSVISDLAETAGKR